MGTEGLLQLIAKAVLQNRRLSDKRNLTGVLNAFLGLFPARTSAVSSETERVFSQTKHTIPDTCCRLGAVIIEATEYKRHWMRAGLGTIVGALSSYLLAIHASWARRMSWYGGAALALGVHGLSCT